MLIGYRDYVQDGSLDVANSSGSFEAGMPFANAQTRQLAVKAQIAPVFASTFVTVSVTLPAGAVVGMAAILTHNITAGTSVNVALYDAMNVAIEVVQLDPPWLPPTDSQFPRNLYAIFSQNYSNAASVRFFFFKDTTFGYSPNFGRLWAGPVWQPAVTTGRRNFRTQTRDDDSVLDRSDGQQNYADPRPRFRQLTCTLPYLTEAEAIGTDDGDTQNLQDLGFEVGKTDPVIVIPTTANNQVIHKFGTYGTFADPPPVDLIEESAGSFEDGLAYSTQFDVIEEL